MAKEILYRALGELKKLPNNPRTIKKDDMERLKKSIKDNPDYFEARPLILSSRTGELVILAGNQRYEAAKALGMDKVPTFLLEGLTEAREREIIIRDNVSNGDWDMDALANEWDEQELDDWGVIIDWKNDKIFDEDYGFYGDERQRTYDIVNLSLFDAHNCVGRYNMPLIKAENHIPTGIIGFNHVLSSNEYDKGVHFYIDDYQFERVWNDPMRYVDKLKNFDCVMTPDFSLYLDMPIAMQIWNVFRSRLIGQTLQLNGIKVIPTLQWSDERSFEFCFDGIEEGGVVSVSTVGVKNDTHAKEMWANGMDEAVKRLNPSCIIEYGGDIGYNYKVDVVRFNNNSFRKENKNG